MWLLLVHFVLPIRALFWSHFFFVFLVGVGSGEFPRQTVCFLHPQRRPSSRLCLLTIFLSFFLFFYSPLILCVLKVYFKRNSSTLQNHQPPFSMEIGSRVSLEESSSLRIPYLLHQKKSPKFPKLPFHSLKFIISIIKKKIYMIFQSKNLIFYFQKKTFKCQLLH